MPSLKNKVTVRTIQRVSLTLFFCLFSSFAFAQTATAITTVQGKVTDKLTSYAIANATVGVYDSSGKLRVSTKTNWLGNYKISADLRYANIFTVKTEANGYQTQSKTAWAKPGQTYTLNSALLESIPPTGTININNDAQYTKSTSVTLNLSATDSGSGMGTGSQMQFSNDNITYSTPEAYATSKTWTLTSDNGSKTVYVKFKDVAGNWSTSVSDTITLDTIPPVMPTINPVTSPTNINSQTITGTKSTDTTTITVTCPTAIVGIVTYPTSTTWSYALTNLSSGTNNITVQAKDAAGNTSALVTTSIVYNRDPQVGTISPSSGTSWTEQAVTFVTTYFDPDGWQNIQDGTFLINSYINGTNCFYGYYSQNTDKFYLRNDNHTAWLGGYAPGSTYVIENSYSKLDCSKTTVSGNGDTLTINWNITFKPSFLGTKNTYLWVKDDIGAYQDWVQKGTWTINLDTTPPTTPIVTDDGEYTSSFTQLHARWTSSDPESAIVEYQYSIGTSPGLTNVVGWASTITNEVTVTGLDLSSLYYVYYFNVKAKNALGLWSPVGSSDGIRYNRPPEICSFSPNDKSSFTEKDTIPIYACAIDRDGDTREFQVYIDGVVKIPWSGGTGGMCLSASGNWGTVFTYDWQTNIGDNGFHKIKVEVREYKGGRDSKEVTIFIYRKPFGPP